jgi:hypothetical protein
VAERLGRTWDRLWFVPEPAVTAIFLRWLVLGVLAADTWQRRASYRSIPDRPAQLWEPTSFLGWVPTPQPGALAVELLLVAIAVGVVVALVGPWPRLGAGLAGVATLVLTAAANSFGKIDHDQQPLVLMVLLVALATTPRAGDADHWRFRWPVQACRLVLAIMLFTAGAAKLGLGGTEWVLSSNLRNILVAENLLFRDPPLTGVALWIASEPWRWQLAAAGAVLGELVLVVAVLARRAAVRAVAAVAGVGTLVGITLLMGLVGFPIVALGAVFAEPGLLLRRWREGVPWRLPLVATLLGIGALTATAATDGWRSALPLVVATAVAWRAARGPSGDATRRWSRRPAEGAPADVTIGR